LSGTLWTARLALERAESRRAVCAEASTPRLRRYIQVERGRWCPTTVNSRPEMTAGLAGHGGPSIPRSVCFNQPSIRAVPPRPHPRAAPTPARTSPRARFVRPAFRPVRNDGWLADACVRGSSGSRPLRAVPR